MKRSSFLVQIIAVALAVLLPVEAAHCAWMMSPIGKSATTMRADHACCRTVSTSAVPEAPASSKPECVCLSMPQAVTHMATAEISTPQSLQASPAPEVMASPASTSRPAPNDRVASPPRTLVLPAHPLRGPPSNS